MGVCTSGRDDRKLEFGQVARDRVGQVELALIGQQILRIERTIDKVVSYE